MSHFRKDVDFNGLFRKLGHSLEEIRVRALESIQSKLDHMLICDADLVQEKLLYIRLLEWFNIPKCSHKAQILALISRLSQHSVGAQLLHSIGAIEFLSQLRCDIEPCHRPAIDHILERIMCLPDDDSQGHAPECIYHRPSDSAVWGASMSSAQDGSRSHISEPSAAAASISHLGRSSNVDKLGRYFQNGPAYFAASLRQDPDSGDSPNLGRTHDAQHHVPAENFFLTPMEEFSGSLFRLSMFPWLPLTQTDQQVIASTNGSLQSKDHSLLIGSCEFLADVVFQDFPAEIFLQRPEILKSLLSLVSMPNPTDHPVVVQACKTLTVFIRCLQVRIRYFQDPALYTSKQDFNSTSPSSMASTLNSGPPSSCYSAQQVLNPTTLVRGGNGVFSDHRDRGDGKDGDSSSSASRNSSVGLEPDPNNGAAHDHLNVLDMDAAQPQHQQLSLPQLLVAVLQRALPRLRTAQLQLGTAVLELTHEVLAVLRCVLDQELWTDTRDAAREVVDRLSDCLDCIGDLLSFHHQDQHNSSPLDPELGELSNHRILYMGVAATLTRFLIMIPLDKMAAVLPELLRSRLPSLIFDQPLAVAHPQCRTLCLAICQSLGLSSSADFQLSLDMCRSLTKTCAFCLQAEDEKVSVKHLAALAEDALPSLGYHLYLPFVSKFVNFTSIICSKRKSDKVTIDHCTCMLLKLMAFPIESIRETCHTALLDTVQQSLQTTHASSVKPKECLKSKFIMNADVLYQLAVFGLADSSAKVRNTSSDCLHHLLQSQMLMSEGLWQELMLALTKALPVLQSYTDESTPLGRRLWSLLDPTTSSHNLSLLDKLRGSLRLMYLADRKVRANAAKHLRWFLCNEQGSVTKLPLSTGLDLGDLCNLLIPNSTSQLEEDSSRSVFTEEGMMQVFDIFTSNPVDPGVKKSAGDQLATMLRDPHLHPLFKEKGGVEEISSIIQSSVEAPNEKADNEEDFAPYVPACITMLKYLLHHDYSLRHTLARDNNLYNTLLRVSLLHQEKLTVKSDVSHLMVLLLFDEVAKFDIGAGEADAPGTRFSLPAQVIHRYRLPFKPSVHHTSSPNMLSLPDPEKDVLLTSGPKGMMRVAWNLAWQGGLEQMLDSFRTRLFQETSNEFCSILQLSEIDRTVLEISCVSWQLRSCLTSIRNAGSHSEVTNSLDMMLAYIVALSGQGLTQFLHCTPNWYTVLERFLIVTPVSSCDQRLLHLVLKFISSALHCFKSSFSSSNPVTPPVLTWLIDKLYRPEGPLMSLMKKSVGRVGDGAESAAANAIKRSLDKQILQYVISINLHLQYQLCKRVPPVLMRGDFVRRLQLRLNVSDAPHFYNLASLEGTLSCLMHVTARPGWSKECSELDATSLCNQLLNSLLEVVWSFHIGRGGTSLSFMGKGVTKSTALCLRHLAYEMNCNSEDKDWVKNWLYSRQDGSLETDQGLNWLITLWAYRDSEVRVAGLGIAVALTSTEAGRVLVASRCKHIPGGIWGAAFSILLDPVECSMVCQQAALLLVNLTSQTMPSGDFETMVAGGANTWQGPVVTDEDYQVVLQGIAALEALVLHTHLYASVSDLLTNVCWISLVQPVLVTTELPAMLETSFVSSASDTISEVASDMERTGRTALTNVTSESGHPTPNASARSKPQSVGSQGSAPDTTLSSSTGTDTSQLRRQAGTSQGENFVNDQGHSVTTPGLVSAVVRLLNNLVQLSPRSCLSGLQSQGILSSLLSQVNPNRVQTLCEEVTSGQSGSAAVPALCNLLAMYTSVADLLTTCVVIDTNTRGELLANKAYLSALASLILFKWHGKDDVGSVCSSLSISVLTLFASLLQTQGPTALVSLSAVLGPVWVPLTESMGSILADRTPDGLPLLHATLDFLALLLTEESRNLFRDPDRVMETATLSELLDTHISDAVSKNVETPESSPAATTGQLLSKALVSLFELAMAVSWEEKASKMEKGEGDLRLKLLSSLKAVLAVSQTAKKSALDAGVVETTVEQLKQTHAQLNLETLGITKLTGRKEGPLLQELVMILDFLRTFMCDNVDVKLACHHSGLTCVLQRLWAWCHQEPSLLSTVLSLLTTYSAHCNSAACSFTSSISATLATSGKSSGGISNSGSLLHYVLKLAQKELDRDECTPLLRLTFGLLTNLALNSDCRTVLWKSPFVNQFSQLNPRKRKGKIRAAVDLLWCELLLALSFSVDGQQIILKIPDSLTVLMDLMEAGSSSCQRNATLIVRNLCCHAPNKPKLLAAEKMVSVLMQQIECRDNEETQLIATSALWALVYNNHKARIQIKTQNIAPRLVDVLHKLQASSTQHQSQTVSNSCLNLKAVIGATRD
ncbi:hypothetical protein RRG08_051444 [Elysia crispata]|uniref:Rotatin N-terminal domain-containing protein n=1 Tax=Elysia crispata TaxID=231223 RepID=A0AAE1EA71_9GAST|nr:hypothetical protein RRG08_051444 [Elysia crispata]